MAFISIRMPAVFSFCVTQAKPILIAILFFKHWLTAYAGETGSQRL
jgi:hypothetical protein